jgi:hypothetical protein
MNINNTPQKKRLNAPWHQAHKIPKNATIEERIARPSEHAKACGCRPIPSSLSGIIEKENQKEIHW